MWVALTVSLWLCAVALLRGVLLLAERLLLLAGSLLVLGLLLTVLGVTWRYIYTHTGMSAINDKIVLYYSFGWTHSDKMYLNSIS